MKPAVRFFYQHAGYSYTVGSTLKQQQAARLNGAKRLARAETTARDAGYSFAWTRDNTTNREWTDEGPEYPLWICVMHDIEGECVQSLAGIDFGYDGEPWSDCYRRVVEAELALEEMP